MSLAASLSGLLLLSVATASNDDGDFRFISQQDLMASSVRFSVEGVNYFGPLLFDVARDQLFIGARDNLFRLSLRGLHELERVSWPAPQGKVDLCINKGQSEDACRNYVKILLSDGNRLFSCGTTAFAPSCAWRALDNASSVIKWESGVAMCPPDPRANITALFSTEGQYYIGTPTDFSGSDFAVYRALGGGLTLRTNQYNSNWLNEPQFVGSFEDDKFVYFIFREAAVEYMNCGKRVYSRIARVCKNDAGGQTALRDNWTTFVKARLNCSEPGEYPFYYDEIQSIEYLPEERLLYGVFTTPPNSIPGSAVCVFNMTAIEDAFRGSFKYKETSGSAWEGRNSRHHLHTHCPSIARQHEVTEALRYQLLDGAVQASSARPLLTVPRRLSLLTAAGPRVLFTATPEGAVLKLSVLPNGRGACMIEEWQPEVGASPIRSLQYLRETDSVYIATEEAVVRVAAARCGRWTARATCLGAQDPQCGWDERHEQCSTGGPRSQWLQGHPACPVLTGPVDGGWSAWGLWEPCLQGEGDQDRCQCQTRRCDSPTPRGGRGCSGASVRVSNCTVHGAWTAWSGWSACSASCGVAVKWRRRACGAPAPAYGGRLCVGPDREEIYCTQNPPCPAPVIAVAEAGWSDWGPWSSCSAPCGGGARWRNRSCNNPPPSPGGGPCPGCATQAEPCNLQACEVRRASAWTPWIPVHSNSSDNLVEKRYRFSCKTQTADNYLKISLSKEEERPRERGSGERTGLGENTNGGWGAWGGWGDCSAECGGGQQSATRPCLQPPCEGSAHIQRACNTHSCIDGWGCWSEWTECSGSCGAGRSQRRRPCLLAGGCEGASVQTRHCQGSPCYESDGWSEWEDWSACDGGAEQLRRRRCLRAPCLGPDLQSRTCIYDDDGTDNELHALAALSPHIVAAGVQGAEGAGSWAPMMGALFGGLVCGVALATGTAVYMRRRRATRIPSSPHYMTQPNSYTSVPLKEVPKKRQSSFSGTSAGGICPAKANNLNSDRTTPKVFLKSMSGEYESSTMKKNSNAPLRNNINLEQEKFN